MCADQARGKQLLAGNAARLAWALWVASLVLVGGGMLFLVLSVSTPVPPGFGFRGVGAIFAVAFSTVGAIITVRRSRNPVGWLFCAAGLGFAVGEFAFEYAVYAVLAHPGLPLGPEAAWVVGSFWPANLGVLAGVFLVFPDGRALSPRWRPAAWLAGLGSAIAVAGFAFTPGPLDEFAVVRNPFGLADARRLTGLLTLVGMLGLGVALLAAGVSLVVRLRRARGEQRQQLKWVAYAAALAGTVWAGSTFVFLLFGVRAGVVSALIICGLLAIPIAACIAILKYRLYDIDRLINRTLVYGLLTALLGGAYAATVLVFGQLFGGIGAEPPPWAVAGTTLAVAALVRPALRRIQQAVDRRFNRRRYDAAKTIEAFSARLREHVELDTLCAELLAVVNQTMQPTSASLWLRPPTRASQDQGSPGPSDTAWRTTAAPEIRS
jgi:hypothetical protein